MRYFTGTLFFLVATLAIAGDPPSGEPSKMQTPLPDPFLMQDGTRVETPEQWREKRRPELLRLFQEHVYGFLPPAGEIEFRVTKTVPDLLDGRATLKEIEIRFPFLECEHPPILHLALVIPNASEQPAPVFLGLNRRGNHAILADERITPTPNAGDATQPAERGSGAETWCVAQLIDRGYAFATFVVDDIDPDKHDFTDGLHACLSHDGVPEASRPGTIAAWAWGIQRAVDYLATDPDIDAQRICVIGHSRRGKTALFAAATDERIALVVPHQSGTGGMALSRDNDQETVERINRVFPHWFCDKFNAYDNNESELPVDQHLLVALVAPRPLLDTAGLQDTWANYESGQRNLKAADAVYEFLGKRGLLEPGVLSADDAISSETVGELLQYRLDTKHVLNSDYWDAILDFADLNLARRE